MELDSPNAFDAFPISSIILKSDIQESINEGSSGMFIDLMKRIMMLRNKNKDNFLYILYDEKLLPIPTQSHFRRHCKNWVDFNNISLTEKHRIYGPYNDEPLKEVNGEEIIDQIRPEFFNHPEIESLNALNKLNARRKLYNELQGKRFVVINGDIQNVESLINNLF